MDKNKLSDFLESKGYQEIRDERSTSFGDYIKQFSSSTIEVRISSSRSFKTLDICNANDRNSWYDMALVKALLNEEYALNKKSSIEDLTTFFINHFNQIESIFSTKYYSDTKRKLEELEKKRVSQIFPNL